ARSWVRVPAKRSAGRDRVLQHPHIRFALGVDPSLPAGRERLRVDLVELSDSEERAGDAVYWRRKHGPAECGDRRDDDEEREHESNPHILLTSLVPFGRLEQSTCRARAERPKNELAR